MGLEYLLDSNAVIDLLMSRMPQSGINYVSEGQPNISINNRIELFCKKDIDAEELDILNRFIPEVFVYQISEPIAIAAINIRISHKLKLPDAVIAATAIANDLILVSRNTKDFGKIQGLKLINPYTL